MTLLTAADGALVVDAEAKSALVVHRKFRDEPDGVNDREVEIWHNDNWVPAYFSDIKKDDFYLIDPMRHMHKEDQCFYAAADCVGKPARQWGYATNGPKTFIIPRGAQIVQAPIKPERSLNELGHAAKALDSTKLRIGHDV